MQPVPRIQGVPHKCEMMRIYILEVFLESGLKVGVLINATLDGKKLRTSRGPLAMDGAVSDDSNRNGTCVQ